MTHQSFFRLRCPSVERCLACEADLEHKAKGMADKLYSSSSSSSKWASGAIGGME